MNRGNNKKLMRRRQAIKSDSLVVGIDIGSRFHAVVMQKADGSVVKGIERLYNSREGFEYLKRELDRVKRTVGANDIHIGFEPTGSYWKNIINYLEGEGYKVHFVRTTAVRSQRELDVSSNSKDDLSDANMIASLVREGKYLDASVQYGVYSDLRNTGKLRAKVMVMKTSMQCRLKMLLGNYFPEIFNYFWSVDSVGLWRLLKVAPFPGDVRKMSEDELKRVLLVKGVKRDKLIEQIRGIKEVAEKSIGLPTNKYVEYNVKECIETLELYHKQLAEIKVLMEELLNKTKYWKLMNSINGVGVVTGATFLGELGDPRNFNNAKEIIKFAGIDPSEKSSGLKKSRSKISKKGRYLMRTMLYFISMRLVYRCDEFKEYYNRKRGTKDSRGNCLEKKEALFAVAIKFVKVLFAMFRDNREYCSEKVGLRLAA